MIKTMINIMKVSFEFSLLYILRADFLIIL